MTRLTPYTGPLQGLPIARFDRTDPRVKPPEQTNGVGWDVFAFLLTESGRETSRAIHQRGVTEIQTGLILHPPTDYFFSVVSKTSLARIGVFVANSPGLVDPSFKEELTILLFNGSFETKYIAHGHRIAQLILTPVPRFDFRERERVSPPKHPEDVHPGPRQGDR
jgi:dUTPase